MERKTLCLKRESLLRKIAKKSETGLLTIVKHTSGNLILSEIAKNLPFFSRHFKSVINDY